VGLTLNGLVDGEAVEVSFYPRPGQQIEPQTLTVTNAVNGATQTVARLTTENLGAQSFGVEVKRLESPDTRN
jgi:hypothetical protein